MRVVKHFDCALVGIFHEDLTMSDMIEVACQCGRKINAPVEYAGRLARCKSCGSPFTFPESAAIVFEADPEEPPVVFVDIPRPATNVAANTPPRTGGVIHEPTIYSIIESLGWLNIVGAVTATMGLGFAAIIWFAREPSAEPLPSWVLWACFAPIIPFLLQALSCFALVDLLRNVWRIRRANETA